MYDLDFFVEELDKFYEENENRSKRYKLLIDPFNEIGLEYNGLKFEMNTPVKNTKKPKKITYLNKKDISNKKNLF